MQIQTGTRTSLFKTARLIIPAILCSVGIMAVLYHANLNLHEAELQHEALAQCLSRKASMMHQLSETVVDLMYISDITHAALVNGTAWQTSQGVLSLVAYSKRKKVYDQILFIAPTGEELFRINNNMGNPAFVPQEALQNKKNLYYVSEALKLWNGSIYISPLDLNVENGTIELPLKPTLRLATPIYDSDMSLRGVVVVNLSSKRMLGPWEDHAQMSHPSFLLNSDGYWLKGRNPKEEFGFMYADRKDDLFQNAYPDAWSKISGTNEGAFTTDSGVFAFTTVKLSDIIDMATSMGNGQQKTYWKIVTHVPSQILMTQASIFVVPFAGIFLMLLFGLSFAMYRLMQHQARRKEAEASLVAQNVAYARFVPEEFCTLMGKTSLPDVELSDSVNCHMAVLFSDIRSFTRFSEGTGNQRVFRLLNDYFSSIDLSIKNNHGFIDKYIGDAVMALFPGAADDAVQGALDMRRHIDRFNERQQQIGDETIKTGIGIHFGEVTLGALGTMRRMQTTAIGDTVNLASRI